METRVRLRELRERRRISQAELARRLGVDRSYVSRLEHGQRLPGLIILSRLADSLGCRLEELVVVKPSGRNQR